MGQITVTTCPIEGLYVIEPAVHGDARGYFMETYNRRDKEFPQGKLVRAIRGRVFDVAVDLRKDSKTFGQWYGVELTEENKKQFYISEGFAHGFLVLSDYAEFCYKVTDFYHPGDEGGLAWNDPEIGIQWPELVGAYPGSADASGYTLSDGTHLTLSDKDQAWETLKNTHHF